ncbi:MAG: hypothetical protein AB7E61_06500 [Acholeplasmataceae bacterium]
MIKRIFKHELNNLTRDPMYIFFALFPFIFALISVYLMPYLKNNAPMVAYHMVFIVFILMNGLIYGAVTGFTLLDDQDDHVLLSLRITPISVRYYILLKLIFSYLIGILGTVVLIFASGFYKEISASIFIMIALIGPLQAPMLALIVNLFATNKVEGFVAMKSSGLILIGPIASVFLTNWTELFVGVLPGFWSTKLIYSQLPNTQTYLNAPWLYFAIGMLVHFIVIFIVFKLYCKKQHI